LPQRAEAKQRYAHGFPRKHPLPDLPQISGLNLWPRSGVFPICREASANEFQLQNYTKQNI